MAAAPLRVGVIGCGPIGALHAEAVRAAPGATLAAVCDVEAERAEAPARRLGGVGAFSRSATCSIAAAWTW